VLIGSSFGLIPALGASGAALSPIVGLLFGCSVICLVAWRSHTRPAITWPPILTAAAIAGACFAGAHLATRAAPSLGAGIDLVALLLYPLLCIQLGVIPRHHLAPLTQIACSVLPRRRSPGAVLQRLATLDPPARAAFRATVADGLSPEDTAARLGLTGAMVARRTVRALRALGGVGVPQPCDDRIGAYLLSPAPPAERDAIASQLWLSGAEPHEVYRLEEILATCRRIRPGAWQACRW